MGAPVVHGIHLVMWALEQVLATEPELAVAVTAIRATFRKPAYLDREIELDACREPDGSLRLALHSADGEVLEMSVRLAPAAPAASVAIEAWRSPVAPDELSRDAAATAAGSIPLAVDLDLARMRFPALCSRLDSSMLAELLALTRLVGMHCPGLHSVFAGLSLDAHQLARGADLTYEVAEAKLKYSMIRLRVSGPRLGGTLETFYRPAPARLDMGEVVQTVTAGELAGQVALVVGGTRGLGEAFAKAIAAGGGRVCVTYHRGAADAARIVDEIMGAGFIASAIQLDVTASRSTLADAWPFEVPPTHLYYLATPTLYSIRKGAAFKTEELDLLIRCYVSGLHAIAASAVGLGAKKLIVWAPSTTMLDASRGGTAYCIAKAAMEELGLHLPSLLPVTVHMPRLGKVDTDQTAGLIELKSASPLAVALEHLRQLSAQPGLP